MTDLLDRHRALGVPKAELPSAIDSRATQCVQHNFSETTRMTHISTHIQHHGDNENGESPERHYG